MGSLPKLNIGAGSHPNTLKRDGFINCDIFPGPGIDKVFDATKTWPFEDNSIGAVRSNHVLEHLDDYQGFFKEMHRCLIPGGVAVITVPYGLSSAAFCDPTHIRYWLPGSFTFLQPGYNVAVFNPQHDSWNSFFEVEYALRRVNGSLRHLVRWPILRDLGKKILPHLVDAFVECTVSLRALKTPEAIEQCRLSRKGNEIPLWDVMHEYEFYGKEYTGGPVELIFLNMGRTIGFTRIGQLSEKDKIRV